MARNYKKYKVYQQSYELAVALYNLTEKFPAHEQGIMISQIRRAAISVPVNIAEGSAKKSQKEFMYFLNVAYGSAKELAVLIDLAKDVGYISQTVHKGLASKIDALNQKMFLFVQHVEQQIPKKNFFAAWKKLSA